jgi:DNA-directed RNA polymerase specialized sigma24 family protein
MGTLTACPRSRWKQSIRSDATTSCASWWPLESPILKPRTLPKTCFSARLTHLRGPNRLRTFSGGCSLAQGLAINRHHRRRREIPFPKESWRNWEALLPDHCDGVENWLYRRQLLRKIGRTLDTITPMEKRCLLLRSQGATYREAAIASGITMDRAIYLTGTAVRKLQCAMEQQGFTLIGK